MPLRQENTYNRQEGAASFLAILLWLLQLAWVARVTLFIRQRTGSEFSSVDIYAGIQIAVVGIVLMLIFMSFKWPSLISKIFGTSLLFLCLYYLICGVSSIWSAMPAFSLYRAGEFFIMLFGVLVAVSYYDRFEDGEKAVLIVATIVIILSLYVNFKFSNNIFSIMAWHTNSYSASAAMVFCYCLGEFFDSEKKRKKMLFSCGLFAFAAVVLGTSSASNISALCGALVILFFHRKFGLFAAGIWLLAMLLILRFVIDFDFSFLKGLLFPGKTDEQIVSMRGRLPMWEVLWEYVLRSPVFGHGFGVLTSGRGGIFSNDPHNSIFSVLLGTGFIGFSVVFFFALRLAREIMQTAFRRLRGAVGCAAAIIAGLVNSMAMPLVFSEWEESSLVFACLISFFILHVVLPYRQQQKEERYQY